MRYNILILSAGRRVELVQLFKKASLDLNIQSRIIAADCSILAPALYFADDKVIIPRIDSKQYLTAIIECCQKYDISLIVPTIDTELTILSESRTKIEFETNAKVLISSEEVIKICRDKVKTCNFLVDNGFGVPELFGEINDILPNEYPVFIKPISGSSSNGVQKVESKQELEYFLQKRDDYMIQKFVGGKEYSVDVFLDFDSRVISIVPRLRIAVRAGEISKGKIEKNSIIIKDIKRLMNKLKPIGHITVQLFLSGNEIKYIEINPRFGGGAPMSILSGADSCKYLYEILMGKTLSYSENYSDNKIFLRYDQSIELEDSDD